MAEISDPCRLSPFMQPPSCAVFNRKKRLGALKNQGETVFFYMFLNGSSSPFSHSPYCRFLPEVCLHTIQEFAPLWKRTSRKQNVFLYKDGIVAIFSGFLYCNKGSPRRNIQSLQVNIIYKHCLHMNLSFPNQCLCYEWTVRWTPTATQIGVKNSPVFLGNQICHWCHLLCKTQRDWDSNNNPYW